MFAYIKGKVTDSGLDWVVIENEGIGYKILTSASTLAAIDREDPKTKLYTRLNVKEDHLELCGFKTQMELELYEHLVSVSGIGTKGAIGILSSLSVESIIVVIIQGDETPLTKVPGIGKKTAQRIIVELRDKFQKRFNIVAEKGDFEPISQMGGGQGKEQEVLQALTALGYTPKEARAAVSKLDLNDLGLEEAIKQAFRLLAK